METELPPHSQQNPVRGRPTDEHLQIEHNEDFFFFFFFLRDFILKKTLFEKLNCIFTDNESDTL